MSTRDVVQGLYDAAAKGDLDGFFALLADDIVIHEPPFLPYGGAWRRKEGVQAMVGAVSSVLDIASTEVQYTVAEGDHAFTVLTVRRADGGERLTMVEEAVVRDGKISELRIYLHDAGGLVVAAG